MTEIKKILSSDRILSLYQTTAIVTNELIDVLPKLKKAGELIEQLQNIIVANNSTVEIKRPEFMKYLLEHEFEISAGDYDFGAMRGVFLDVIGREAKHGNSNSDI